jgi:hypothetical protein
MWFTACTANMIGKSMIKNRLYFAQLKLPLILKILLDHIQLKALKR